MEVDFRTWRPMFGAALLAACLVWLFNAPVETQRALAAENRPVELASALFLLAGMVMAAYAAVQAGGALRWYLALWAVLCLLFFGEETSWLQHLIGYQTPAFIAEQNVRGELNLHNLRLLHGGELVGAEFHWRSLFKAQHLFNLASSLISSACHCLRRARRGSGCCGEHKSPIQASGLPPSRSCRWR